MVNKVNVGDTLAVIVVKERDLRDGDIFPRINNFTVTEVRNGVYRGSNEQSQTWVLYEEDLDTVEKEQIGFDEYQYIGYRCKKTDNEIIKDIVDEFVDSLDGEIAYLTDKKDNILNEYEDYVRS